MKKIVTITRHNWFIRFVKRLIKAFKKSQQIIAFGDSFPEKAIYIANHNGAAGPLTLNIYFPKILVPWGTYEMMGNYRTRWAYLYRVFYQKKLKYGKFRAFVLAAIFGLVSKILYDGVSLIPTYPDIRVRRTMEESLEHLRHQNSILIFPEDSSNGYQDEIASFHSGFVYLAQQYYRENGIHIPIIPLYYRKENRQIAVGKPYTLADFSIKTERKGIAEQFRVILNQLADPQSLPL